MRFRALESVITALGVRHAGDVVDEPAGLPPADTTSLRPPFLDIEVPREFADPFGNRWRVSVGYGLPQAVLVLPPQSLEHHLAAGRITALPEDA